MAFATADEWTIAKRLGLRLWLGKRFTGRVKTWKKPEEFLSKRVSCVLFING